MKEGAGREVEGVERQGDHQECVERQGEYQEGGRVHGQQSHRQEGLLGP